MSYESFAKKINKIPHGGDYNPEQWPEEIWEKDMKLFKEAGIDCLTLNIFSWAIIQPSENSYDFSKLDKIVRNCVENNMKIIMATSTAAHPAWMAKRYPDITRVMFNGIKRKFGGRHNSCPNSPTLMKYAPRLAGKLAEHFKDCGNIIAWHVSNEYNSQCYCENCEKAFRVWLKEKYKTIDELNYAWNTSFWSHTFYDFDEVVAPDSRTEMSNLSSSEFPAITLDYWRFLSDSVLNNYIAESDAIKQYMPDCPVTTNFMGEFKELDYQKWAKHMDFTSWDSYPMMTAEPSETSMWHDMIRSLKQGKPWVLMEQTPSVQNWQEFNMIKRPGVARLWSYRAIAHGADGILYFQMRRSRGACEKTHGAIIDHVGHGNTRAFREIAYFGKELKKLGNSMLGALYPAETAVLFDWDNWWDYELCSGPHKNKKYMLEIKQFYHALYVNNVPVNFVSVEDDLSKYKLLIAPSLFMVKSGYDKKINEFVKRGGLFVTNYYSGMVNETDLMYLDGHPGPLSEVLGIWVEETDSMPLDRKNHFTYKGNCYEASMIFDIISEVKGKVLACYEEEFYQGTPVITENSYGVGKAYYVATHAENSFYTEFIKDLIKEAGIKPVWKSTEFLEVTVRKKGNNCFYYILNHSDKTIKVIMEHTGVDLLTDIKYSVGNEVELAGRDLIILNTEE